MLHKQAAGQPLQQRRLFGSYHYLSSLCRLVVLLALGMIILLSVASAQAAPLSQSEFHTVQAGETWASIAASYAIPVDLLWRANGVINPALLAEGQRLFIPNIDSRLINSILGLQVQPGISVWRLALKSGNSLAIILRLNGFQSPAEVFGQSLYAPIRQIAIAENPTVSTGVPTVAPPTPTVETPTITAPQGALLRSRLGIQGHFSVSDDQRRQLLDMVAYDLGFAWVKYQVNWALIEYAPDQYSAELDALDAFMQQAYTRNLRILLSVTKAPDWARATTEEDGPPVDYNAYYDFIKFLVLRYKYQIAAIEIWNEPNLRREWNGAPLSAADYVRLLAGAYQTIKREYPEGNIIVISAGLSPTGINDGTTAIDDRLYLHQMYEAGLANYADAIGIHPYSWANPPWLRCCGDPSGPPAYNNHPSFFFLNTIEDYRAIQAEFNDSARPLWATEFGWGTMEGLDQPIPESAPFFAYMGQELQARYILSAYQMAQEWDFMGPMFLWNLNVATLGGFDPDQGAYSLLIGNLVPRLAYNVLRDTPKVENLP
jgi:LysM repeat protein